MKNSSFSKNEGGIEEGTTIYIAGDLRKSTDKIMRAVAKAIEDSNFKVKNCGNIPTPALIYYAMQNGCASIMITGSHIPDDRNGIKPNKSTGEVLKEEELAIKENIIKVRAEEYAKLETNNSLFDLDDMLKIKAGLPPIDDKAKKIYLERYLKAFPVGCLRDKKIVVYEHSAVGRDILVEVLKSLGAEVVREGRSDDAFIPVDTEAVREEDLDFVKWLAQKHKPFAVVSTDGDSDRPLLADENGEFLRGDLLGILAASYFDVDFAAVPIISNDAIDLAFEKIKIVKTKTGSPYVVKAMLSNEGDFKKIVGWEANGGFLTLSDFDINGKRLKALPTRDAILPLIATLLLAIKEEKKLSELIEKLPKRFSHSEKIKNFPIEIGREIIEKISLNDQNVDIIYFNEQIEVLYKNGDKKTIRKNDDLFIDLNNLKKRIEGKYFSNLGFSEVKSIVFTDGVRIKFENDDVIHFRPSGNSPEFRCYSNTNSKERAIEIVKIGLSIIIERIKNDIGSNDFVQERLEKKSRREYAVLEFGTSGLRGLVEDMTDLECYINVRGYIEYLKELSKRKE